MNQWKGQLEALVLAFPCLQELTVGSKLSSMAAQQLGVLAGAKQLHVLHLPYGQALHDRSLLVRGTSYGLSSCPAQCTSTAKSEHTHMFCQPSFISPDAQANHLHAICAGYTRCYMFIKQQPQLGNLRVTARCCLHAPQACMPQAAAGM